MSTHPRTLIALIAAGVLLAVNGLVLGPMWLVVPGEFSDTVATPAFVISQQVSWALLTALIVLVPSLSVAGRLPLPAWIVPVVQVALAAQAATHFVQGFVSPWLATVAPDALDLTEGGLLQVAMTVIGVAFLIAIATFGVTLWWAGFSRSGVVLTILGALAAPAVGPIGAGFVGLGLVLVAVRALRELRARRGPSRRPEIEDAEHEPSSTGPRIR
jgi:hypothetical protein